ncbi:unnamed protein product, partial [Effrenium voratum]
MEEVGPAVVFACHLLHLMPHYYLLNALILAQRQDQEWFMHSALLQSELLSVALEMLWSAYHPEALRFAWCAWCAALCAALQCVNMVLACVGTTYSYQVALAFQVAAGLALIPVRQVGNNFTLARRVSPARYRILAWLVAVLLAVTCLLSEQMASVWVLAPCAALPALGAAVALASATGRGAGGTSEAKLGSAGNQGVGWGASALFLALGCGLGTTGEAMMDMAVNLAVRRRLQQGSRDLALMNQFSIFCSMSLAYLSETQRFGAHSSEKFIGAWLGCQLLRGFSLHLLEAGQLGVALLAVFAFLDKYTGPLGAAALDVALLRVLEPKDSSTAWCTAPQARLVPSTLLWTSRMVFARVERPACKLLLLHFESLFAVEQVALTFSCATCAGVLAVLWATERPAKGSPVAFGAKLAASIAGTASGWKEVTGFTTSVSSQLFNSGDHLNLANGRFTAPVTGYYHFSTNMRLDLAVGSYFRVFLFVNSGKNGNFPGTLKGSPLGNYYTLSTSGSLWLGAGQYVSVWIYSGGDTLYTIQSESGFSGHLISTGGVGFHAYKASADAVKKTGDVNVQGYGLASHLGGSSSSMSGLSATLGATNHHSSSGWKEITGWSTNGANMFGSALSNGRFTAPSTGVYQVSCNLRLDNANGNYFRVLIAIDGNADVYNGLHTIQGRPGKPYYTLPVMGTVKLSAGQYVSCWAYSNSDTSWSIQRESGFSVAFLGD